MRRILSPSFVVITVFSCVTVSASSFPTQSDLRPGWKAARGEGLYFQVPRTFETVSGRGPGYIGSTQFMLSALTALDREREVFVSAGHGVIPLAPGIRGSDLNDLAEETLKELFSPIMIPGIGSFTLDPDQAETTDYQSLGAYVRETTADLDATGDEFRVYFIFKLRSAGPGRAKLIYIISGCPEEEIDDYNRVMSTILSTFRLD